MLYTLKLYSDVYQFNLNKTRKKENRILIFKKIQRKNKSAWKEQK